MTPMLRIEPSDLEAGFGRAPFRVGHDLGDHRLLQLDRIGDLADALPPDQVEHNLGAVPDVLPGGEAPRLDATPGEIARGIHDNGCWMVLKFIESDAEYRGLLNELLDEVAPLVPAAEGETTRREGFIFLSAPSSTTPAHVDPEHNFLLQIQGTKTMVIGRFPDERSEQLELERHYGGGHRNMQAMFDAPQDFELAPADGVYVPVHAPHLVRNGPAPSISLSITWRTTATERAERAHVANARLRRLGLSPAMPGRRPGADQVKALAARSVRGIQRRVGSRRP
jgi:cupin superfamily protein